MDGSRALSCFRICLVLLACLGAVSAFGWGPANAADATNADAVWKKAGADEGLRQAFERARYSLQDSGHGTWRGATASVSNPGTSVVTGAANGSLSSATALQ
jgi:hypothetical protein